MEKAATKWVLGHQVTIHETTGDYDLMMGNTPSGMQGPPPHFHNSLKEAFLIVDGEMEFFVNGEIVILRAGQSIDIAPNTLHTFANKSDKPCIWVNIHSPKGFRGFFEQIGIPETEDKASEKSLAPEIIEKVMSLSAEFDMTFQI
jgi:mannose-6-phosphate isomerase-like protein (cupin superfamily)